jgi:hypothetical protein
VRNRDFKAILDVFDAVFAEEVFYFYILRESDAKNFSELNFQFTG